MYSSWSQPHSAPPRANQLACSYDLTSAIVYNGQHSLPNWLLRFLLKSEIPFPLIYQKLKKTYLMYNGSLDLNLKHFRLGTNACQEIITELRFDSHVYFCTNLPSRNKIVLSLKCQSAYRLNLSARYHFPLIALYGISCHCHMTGPQMTIQKYVSI